MLKNILKLLGVALLTLVFTSCETQISDKHKKMHWDRDMCVRCKMVMSERNHAVQIINKKTGDGYMFDDIGCAVLWFQEENIQWEDDARIWITDVKTKKWIDAKKAFYDTIHHTPMAYGFSANEKKSSISEESEILDFEEVSQRIKNNIRAN